MSRIENLAKAGYITHTELIGDPVAEEWSIQEMIAREIITKTHINIEKLEEIANGPVATPTFSYDDVKNELSVSCTTEDALIYVMIDNDPYVLYNGPIDVTKVYTVIAQAKKEGYKDSNTNLWEKLI